MVSSSTYPVGDFLSRANINSQGLASVLWMATYGECKSPRLGIL